MPLETTQDQIVTDWRETLQDAIARLHKRQRLSGLNPVQQAALEYLQAVCGRLHRLPGSKVTLDIVKRPLQVAFLA